MNPTPHAPATTEPTTAQAQQTAAEQDVCEHAWRACGGRAYVVARIGEPAGRIVSAFAHKSDADFVAMTLNDGANKGHDIYEVVELHVHLERPGPIDWPKGIDASVADMLHAARLITDTLAAAHERELTDRELDTLRVESMCLQHAARRHKTSRRESKTVSSRPAASAAGVPQPASTTRDAGASGLRAAS